MKVLVKKFSLRRNGKVYTVGDIVSMPDAEAEALVAASPDEFALVGEAKQHKEAKPAAVVDETLEQEEAEAEEEEGLPGFDPAALVRK